ncbi:DUF3291 domain-containing protein [Nocardiopsis lucentensis]|uniref:DUF3291 domain-containing protein n=1 Tax=Nocardiopsis lucentensis TaxID=53441 RepID=UPI000347AAF7|nr:DUF3291 domain-containing protein [Nocardiopsis lucentensis]
MDKSTPAPAYQLAQLNIAVMRAPLDDPSMRDFADGLDRINGIAESSPGYVWRLLDDGGKDATGLRDFGDDVLMNLSVWKDVDALWDFTYRSDHLDFLRRRREWFERMREAFVVLWWIPTGTLPTVGEAKRRLDLLRTNGPSPEAFDLRTPFPAPTHHDQHA